MTIDKKGKYEPILADVEIAFESTQNPDKGRSLWIGLRNKHILLSTLQAVLLIANISLIALNMSYPKYSNKGHFVTGHVDEPYSPAHSIVKYEIRKLDLTATRSSPYFGNPRPELDKAWAELTQSGMVEISAEDMKLMNKSSIAIQGNGTYVGYYAVYHQLHCLKRIYQMNYKEYYSDLIFTMEHFQHCLEVLRQGLMCKSDLTVNTMDWQSEASIGYVGITAWDRKCIHWDSFHAWTNTQKIPTPLGDFLVPKDINGSFGP